MNALLDERVKMIVNALDGQVRLVGGCVRDYLIGWPLHDIDLATPLKPEAVIQKLTDAGIRVVPTGLKHGTVTAVIHHKPFEITTLRHDLKTDGRHAVVEWTDDYAADANRRDFTINALYMDAGGKIFDYVDGRIDLKKRQVRFIGQPAQRIAEDYLRILRYFRFFGLIDVHRPDPSVLRVLREKKSGLAGVSKERITSEFFKILMVPRVLTVLKMMQQTGILSDIVGAAHVRSMRRFLSVCPDAGVLERLAVLTGGKTGVLCLSNEQKRVMKLYCLPVRIGLSLKKDKLFFAHHNRAVFDFHIYRAQMAGRLSKGQARFLLLMQQPVFPISASDLMEIGVSAGPVIGKLLKKAERIWQQSGFISDKNVVIRQLMCHNEYNQVLNKKRRRK